MSFGTARSFQPTGTRTQPNNVRDIPGGLSQQLASRGGNMGDNISTYNGPMAEYWHNYLSQFQAQNPAFRNFQYAPEGVSTVAPLHDMNQQALQHNWNVSGTQSAAGRNIMHYGAQGAQVGSPGAAAAAGRAAGSAWGGAGSLAIPRMDSQLFNSFRANDALEGEIDRVSGDIMRNTTENVIPGLATSAVGVGNAYSTKAQHSYDRALTDAREATADAAATMRFNNFNSARQLATGVMQGNQQTELARRSGVSGANMQYANLLQQIGQAGVGNQLAGTQLQGQGADRRMGVGQYMQDYSQAMRDDQIARFRFEQMTPFMTMPYYTNALAPPAGMPFSIGTGGATSPGPNLGSLFG